MPLIGSPYRGLDEDEPPLTLLEKILVVLGAAALAVGFGFSVWWAVTGPIG